MIDIHHIIYLHLAEALGSRYDEAHPELGVPVAWCHSYGTQFRWRLVVDDGRLRLELRRVNRTCSFTLIITTVELDDPGSLDPETILGLKDLAVNQAESVTAMGLLQLSGLATA